MIKKINVLNKIYTIELRKDLIKETGLCGFCDPDALILGLDADLDPIAMDSSLAHEIGHAFQNELGLSETFDGHTQEMFATCFSNFICSQFNWSLKD